MKKVILLTIIIIMTFAIVACNAEQPVAEDDRDINHFVQAFIDAGFNVKLDYYFHPESHLIDGIAFYLIQDNVPPPPAGTVEEGTRVVPGAFEHITIRMLESDSRATNMAVSLQESFYNAGLEMITGYNGKFSIVVGSGNNEIVDFFKGIE